jgi:uncharacterized protein (TIGR04255 family)
MAMRENSASYEAPGSGSVYVAMAQALKNPPLIEAVCEFRFAPGSEWDWTIPGRLYDKIKREFPERSELHRIGVAVRHRPNDRSAPALIEAGPDRIQLKRPDGSAMVQVGPGMLAINHLRPYERWEVFRDLVLQITKAYGEVATIHPLGRIGLRYINQIPRFDRLIEQIIGIWPSLGGSLNRPVKTFYQRYELQHEMPQGVLIHQTGIQATGAGDVVMLDLDFVSEQVSELRNEESIQEWLNRAHERVEEGFVDSLTPDYYEQLLNGAS